MSVILKRDYQIPEPNQKQTEAQKDAILETYCCALYRYQQLVDTLLPLPDKKLSKSFQTLLQLADAYAALSFASVMSDVSLSDQSAVICITCPSILEFSQLGAPFLLALLEMAENIVFVTTDKGDLEMQVYFNFTGYFSKTHELRARFADDPEVLALLEDED